MQCLTEGLFSISGGSYYGPTMSAPTAMATRFPHAYAAFCFPTGVTALMHYPPFVVKKETRNHWQ